MLSSISRTSSIRSTLQKSFSFRFRSHSWDSRSLYTFCLCTAFFFLPGQLLPSCRTIYTLRSLAAKRLSTKPGNSWTNTVFYQTITLKYSWLSTYLHLKNKLAGKAHECSPQSSTVTHLYWEHSTRGHTANNRNWNSGIVTRVQVPSHEAASQINNSSLFFFPRDKSETSGDRKMGRAKGWVI